MSKVTIVLCLCFVWACNTGVIALQILAITGVTNVDGPPSTWGDLAEQVFLGLFLSAALVAFYKFKNRKPRDPGV